MSSHASILERACTGGIWICEQVIKPQFSMAPIREEKKNEKNEKQINVFLITSGEIRNSIRILLGQWIVDIVTLCERLRPLVDFPSSST
ncbi:hypothetical protein OUZ56_028214 [Daphnia magna]|uniref:Uncharacterized protein n=1 Tax=Daphnia magna TaxID=35525 RepID=A0ABR0B3D7_9CRUS|nr:hypothetical protein OUZ56_028214 [Daphnia magna]